MVTTTQQWTVPHVYLRTGFSPDSDNGRRILSAIEHEMRFGRYTLGPAVEEFEQAVARKFGVAHAIGVNSGTDALFLALKSLGIGSHGLHQDEVITSPFTFYATVNAIINTGAKPVFVDVGPDYNMDYEQIGKAITKRTKAILPVWWAGSVGLQGKKLYTALHSGLPVVEDACQAIGGKLDGQYAGTFGIGAFSLHPLKNVNVMGDGGFITTLTEESAKGLRLLRNHGLQDRDTCTVPGYNSRLDTIQALVASIGLAEIEGLTANRQDHAKRYDAGLSKIQQVTIPPRYPNVSHVYHLYQVNVERRDELKAFLRERGIEALVHYPVPMHLQPAYAGWGYKQGQFPVAEHLAETTLTLPVHQYLTTDQIDYVIKAVLDFYA